MSNYDVIDDGININVYNSYTNKNTAIYDGDKEDFRALFYDALTPISQILEILGYDF
jgi:hypothetical protein